MSDRPRVVASFLSSEQEYQTAQAACAGVVADRAGLSLEVVFAENSAITQVQQLFRFIHVNPKDRPLAIVVQSVSGEGLERMARLATQAGIGWVLVNRDVEYLAELRTLHPDLLIFGIGMDQLEMGRIQGRQIRALLPNGGRILYLQGPADTSAAKKRLEGTQEVLTGLPIQMHVISGTWTEASSEKATSIWLRFWEEPIDLVASQNDAMAVGARRAILSRRKEWPGIRFLGMDGLPNGGQRLVDEEQLAATVVAPLVAGAAVELLARWLKSGEQPPTRISLSPSPYPKDDSLLAP